MARRGGSIYVSTDPNNVTPIGVAGAGISIGPLGPLIYKVIDLGDILATELGLDIITESTSDPLLMESAP